LYEEKGKELLHDLNGEFAFALWDARARAFFMARDRFGVKPLYYCACPRGFFFASELKSLRAVLPFEARVDTAALDEYLTYQCVHGERSIIAGVKKLPPGHCMVADSQSTCVERYWQLPLPSSALGENGSEEKMTHRLLELLEDSIRMRLVSDVPLGAFLSGGIDSSAVTAFASRHSSSPLRTVSVGFREQGFDETAYARIVAARFKTDHSETIASQEKLEDLLPDIVWHLDEPFADSSAVPTYLLSKLTAQRMTVALSGDGGDELFGGYPKYGRERLFSFLRGVPFFPALGAALSRFVSSEASYGKSGFSARGARTLLRASMGLSERYRLWSFFFTPYQKRRLLTSVFGGRDSVEKIVEELRGSKDGAAAVAYIDARLYLPDDLLVKVDRMSMAHSLEVRVPFLDHRLAEFAARVPFGFKLRNGTSKYILKKALKDILPREILRRPKQGFAVPVDEWFRTDLAASAERLLTGKRSAARGYFNQAFVRQLFEEHSKRVADHGHRLWALLMFELWNVIFIDGKGNYRKGTRLSELSEGAD
jgi:asparagine synthase (glutamine-hydrolysing)